MERLLALILLVSLCGTPSRAVDSSAQGQLRGAAGNGSGPEAGNVPSVGSGSVVAESPPEVDPKAAVSALGRGVAYLKKSQQADGSWRVSSNPAAQVDNIYFRSAITAIVIDALKEAAPGDSMEEVKKGEGYLDAAALGEPQGDMVHFGGETSRIYALSYGLESTLRRGASKKRDELVRRYIAKIDGVRKAGNLGYWGRGAISTFQSAPLAGTLKKAKEEGFEVPEALIKILDTGIEGARDPNSGAFSYRAGGGASDARGGSCRSVSCEAALDSPSDKKAAAVDRFLEHRGTVEGLLGRNDLTTHDHALSNLAKYYHLYGMYWSSELLKELAGDEKFSAAKRSEKVSGKEWTAAQTKRIAAALIKLQKSDGSWEDEHVYGGPAYGTGMGIRTLKNCMIILASE